jgi:hypothetical protein
MVGEREILGKSLIVAIVGYGYQIRGNGNLTCQPERVSKVPQVSSLVVKELERAGRGGRSEMERQAETIVPVLTTS